MDEFGFIADRLKTNKISVNVRVPDYKINAMDTYNWVVGAEILGVGLSAVLFVALALLSKGGTKGTVSRGAVSALSAVAIKELARQVKTELKIVMDDPPACDRKYKNIYIAPQLKSINAGVKISLGRARHIAEFKAAAEKFVILSKAARITNNRLWTARIRKDQRTVRLQNKKYKYYQNEFFKSSINLINMINRLSAELMKLKQTRQTKIVINYLKILAKKFYTLSESLK